MKSRIIDIAITMSGFDGDKDSSSSSPSLSRQVPVLKSVRDFDTWRPLIEQYINDCGYGRVLTMKITNFAQLVKESKRIESSDSVYKELGISFESEVAVSSVKMENECKDNQLSELSAEARKELVKIVKSSERVYNILFRSIPVELRVQIGSEHAANGGSLWQWLVSTLEPTSAEIQMELLEQLFAIRQQAGEKFAVFKARVDKINDKLAASGADLKPVQYRHLVLSRVLEPYRHMVININMNKELRDDPEHRPALWIKITSLLTNHEQVYMKDELDLTTGTAMAARTNRPTYVRKDFSEYQCYNCGRLGHVKRQCKFPTKEQSQVEQANSAVAAESDASADAASSAVGGYCWSAVAVSSKTSYSAIVGASLSSAPKVSVPVPAAASSSSAAPRQLKRLIRPPSPAASSSAPASNSSASLAPRSPAPASSASSKKPAAPEVRRQVLQNAKKPGPTVARPLEVQLKQSSWGLDSMASVHVTGNKSLLSGRRGCTPMRIMCANGETIVASTMGTVTLRMRSQGGTVRTVRISDVYYSEQMSANLLSAQKLCQDLKMQLTISPEGRAFMQSETGMFFPIKTQQSVLTLSGDVPAIAYSASATRTVNSVSKLVEAHRRLNHIGFDRLVKVLKSSNTRGLGQLDMSADEIATAREQVMHCNACKEGKGTQQPYTHLGPLNHGTAPGEVIHMDTFESRTPQVNQLQYGIVMVDPYTGGLFCPMVATKDKVANAVIAVLKQIHALTGNKLKVLHSDGGTEFLNHTLKSYCTENGITMQQSPPRTPKHNGIAERHVRTIKDGTRSMLAQCGLNGSWGSRASAHFVYVWNRIFISEHTKVTPYESYYKMQPSVNSTGVFGCDVYVWLHKDTREAGTYAPRGEPGIYLGHDAHQNCAIVLLIKSDKEVRSRSVDYRENQFKYAHALIKGSEAVSQVITDSDVGGSLAWYDAVDSSIETRLDHISQSTAATESDTESVTESVSSSAQEGPESDTENSEPEYAVERIMKHRKDTTSDDGYSYHVKWEGFSMKQATWEPSRSFAGSADDILTEYRSAQGLSNESEEKAVMDEESASRN